MDWGLILVIAVIVVAGLSLIIGYTKDYFED